MSCHDVEGVNVAIHTDDGPQLDRALNTSGTRFLWILRWDLLDDQSMGGTLVQQALCNHPKATDWVFLSEKTHGRSPRVGNMLCVDYLRPAARKAGVKLEKGQRFGFHNLRHSLASFLVTKKKTDVKTAQRSMRHAKSSTMLDHCAHTDMDELIAAQEMML